MTETDRWALVTGGSGDIGASICARLASDGYHVLVHYFRGRARAEAVAGRVRLLGRQADVVGAHLGTDGGVDGVVSRALSAAGKVDVVVLNAASGVMRPAGELTRRHLDWAWSINAASMPLLLTRLLPRAAVAVSSLGSVRVVPDYAGVAASKAAMESLTRYLAVELAPGTRVNAVQAGLVVTRALDHLPAAADLLDDARARTPLGRLVSADDVASAVAWLASPEASMVTGAILVVDGGRSLHL
ncbi:MAG: SDR family oxidoreductase [Acidimicrobiales bacterium]